MFARVKVKRNWGIPATVMLALQLWMVGFVIAQEVPTGNLSDPRDAVLQHVYWLQAETYNPDKAALAMPDHTDPDIRRSRAVMLKQILDGKGLFIRLERIPVQADYKDSITQSYRYVPFPYELPEVYLERKDERWQYSLRTFTIIPELHRKTYPFGTEILTKAFGRYAHREFWSVPFWKWGGLLVLPLLLLAAYWVLYVLMLPLMRATMRRFGEYDSDDLRSLKHFDRYFSMWILAKMSALFIPLLQLPPRMNAVLLHGLNIAAWCIVLLIGLRFVDLLFGHVKRKALAKDPPRDIQFIPVIKKIVQLILWIAVLIPILRLLEVNLTALIAGLSIGGLALALAAQDTVKNLISTVLIFFDHPYRLGDFIKAAGIEGTVVEIGFRSTRLMTIDSSIITIPNSVMINDQVVNLGARVFRLVHFMIAIVYSTPSDKIAAFVDQLRAMASDHPDTVKEQIMIFLSDLNSSSIDIRFRVPVAVNDIVKEYEAREELVTAVIQIARQMGISFAYPSQSLYLEKSSEALKTDIPDDIPTPFPSMDELRSRLREGWVKKRTILPDPSGH